jgi:hypothetical protein
MRRFPLDGYQPTYAPSTVSIHVTKSSSAVAAYRYLAAMASSTVAIGRTA